MKARIINSLEFGGIYTDEFITSRWNNVINGQFVSEWELIDELPNPVYKKPEWVGGEWVETYIENIVVPETLSRMKFKMQVRRSTIYSYDIILEYLKNLVVTESFDQDMKDDIIDRFEDCVIFERYSIDFITIANILSVSDEIKDEIFIEGNKIT